MAYRLHLFPGLTLLLISFAIQYQLTRWLFQPRPWPRAFQAFVLAINAAVAGLSSIGYLLGFHRILRHLPVLFITWMEAAALANCVGLVGLFVAVFLWRKVPPMQSHRRAFLRAGIAALVSAPYAAAAFGIVDRNRFQLNEINLRIPNLPRDLDGLRIVQITDIHMSPFLSEQEFARAVDMANETRAHIGLVTGDLISRTGDPVDACLRQLSRLRADSAILGCLGNHEVYAHIEDYVTIMGRRIGIDFLRDASRQLRFGNSTINFAGVDYQKFNEPYLVGTERHVRPGMLNILLSHNPDVFPKAAAMGFDLTISGHTHGGQVNFEILHQNVNIARYYTPYVKGEYRRGNSAIYVSTGLGTIGLPIRAGAPAEVALIRLCAS